MGGMERRGRNGDTRFSRAEVLCDSFGAKEGMGYTYSPSLYYSEACLSCFD